MERRGLIQPPYRKRSRRLRKKLRAVIKRHQESNSRSEKVPGTFILFNRARPAREVLPKLFGDAAAKQMLKPRGRPKTGNARVSISLRLPPKTLARWKATGSGWQTRMAETLKKAV